MQRSSESIACLATALAKAQAELTNPEKSLVATIRPSGPGEAERSFRYAPLSSGLDIVRKTLRQHEIATMQTTAIDQTGGIVNLTTVLAHSSGEWIASDWPVCAVSETATPHRMGAALTYARRYALFTLVGIAGEDDIDAPDLKDLMPPASAAAKPTPNRHGRLNGAQTIPGRGGSKVVSNPAKPVLGTEASATLHDQLMDELKEITSSDDAAVWAHRIFREEPEAGNLLAANTADKPLAGWHGDWQPTATPKPRSMDIAVISGRESQSVVGARLRLSSECAASLEVLYLRCISVVEHRSFNFLESLGRDFETFRLFILLPKLPHTEVCCLYVRPKPVGIEQRMVQSVFGKTVLISAKQIPIPCQAECERFILLQGMCHEIRKADRLQQARRYPSRERLSLARQHRKSCPQRVVRRRVRVIG
jgi:ERF superfamily